MGNFYFSIFLTVLCTVTCWHFWNTAGTLKCKSNYFLTVYQICWAFLADNYCTVVCWNKIRCIKDKKKSVCHRKQHPFTAETDWLVEKKQLSRILADILSKNLHKFLQKGSETKYQIMCIKVKTKLNLCTHKSESLAASQCVICMQFWSTIKELFLP